MFGIAAVTLGVAAVLAALINVPGLKQKQEKGEGPRWGWFLSLTREEKASLARLMGIYLMRNTGVMAIYTYLPLYMTELGMSLIEVGILFSIFDLMAIVLAVPCGQLVDKTRRIHLLLGVDVTGMLALSALCALTTPPVWIAALGFVIARIVGMPSAIGLSVQASTILAEHHRPQVFALRTVVMNIGTIIAPAAAGALLDVSGTFRTLFVILAITAFLYGSLAGLDYRATHPS
jgi:predicted MFS family arabinose efflux permease